MLIGGGVLERWDESFCGKRSGRERLFQAQQICYNDTPSRAEELEASEKLNEGEGHDQWRGERNRWYQWYKAGGKTYMALYSVKMHWKVLGGFHRGDWHQQDMMQKFILTAKWRVTRRRTGERAETTVRRLLWSMSEREVVMLKSESELGHKGWGWIWTMSLGKWWNRLVDWILEQEENGGIEDHSQIWGLRNWWTSGITGDIGNGMEISLLTLTLSWLCMSTSLSLFVQPWVIRGTEQDLPI